MPPVGTIPDLVGPDLKVLFCGINPGALSGQLGLHFARRGNRFWRLLHESGFTPTLMETSEQAALPDLGVGITNLVARPTAAASDLRPEELRAGALILERTVERLQPKCVAVLGMQAFRTAFAQPKATIGPQPERLAQSEVWLLPNPSGLQARYQMPEMVGFFRDLHRASR